MTLFDKILGIVVLLMAALGIYTIVGLWPGCAHAQADLPMESTTASTFQLKAQLGAPGEGDEICAVAETDPNTHIVCAAPVADAVDLTVPVIKGAITNYRAVTKLGTTVSATSPNMKPVEGMTVPPTVLE